MREVVRWVEEAAVWCVLRVEDVVKALGRVVVGVGA